jgi:PAS domain S-box-containing protein
MDGISKTGNKSLSHYLEGFIEDLPISTIVEDISDVRPILEKLKQQNIDDLFGYLKAHREILLEISAAVKIIAVNRQTLLLFKAESRKEFLKSLKRVPDEESIDHFIREVVALAEGRSSFEGETTNRTVTGEKIHIFLKWAVPSDGDPNRLFVHIIDITDRIAMEEKLMHSERKLGYLNRIAQIFLMYEGSSSAQHILDAIIEAAESSVGVFGQIDGQGNLTIKAVSEEAVKKGPGWLDRKDYPHAINRGIWERAIAEGKSFFENRPVAFSRSHHPISRVLSTPLTYQGRVTGVITVANKHSDYDANDVMLLESIAAFIAPVLNAQQERSRQEKERLRMEQIVKESEELHRMMIETSPDSIITVDLKGFVTSANEAAFRQTYYSREEVIGRHFTKLNAMRVAELPSYLKVFNDLIMGKAITGYEMVLAKKDGTLYHCEVSATLMKKEGKPCGILIISKDITERKKAEMELKASLKEKELLLKEVHHRVKNNMQIISSLLNLQSVQAQDRTLRELLQESKNRVRSMALIHEKLYRSNDLAHINFGEYMKSLVESLFKSVKKRGVTYSIESKDAFLEIDQAIPCGLIVNELISNTLKHAFPDGKTGKVCVSFSVSDDGKASLTVKDNGVGLPPDFGSRETDKLGLQLVNDLAFQLGGAVTMGNDSGEKGGTEITVVFPLAGAPRR